jgi:hypothetical protein
METIMAKTASEIAAAKLVKQGFVEKPTQAVFFRKFVKDDRIAYVSLVGCVKVRSAGNIPIPEGAVLRGAAILQQHCQVEKQVLILEELEKGPATGAELAKRLGFPIVAALRSIVENGAAKCPGYGDKRREPAMCDAVFSLR